jgi:(1->4)-alpha-D-glucan 1-alpha-D-glucosylmutase
MHVLRCALKLRQTHRELFEKGDYLPIPVTGKKAEHIVAFVRRWRKRSILTVAPRLIAGLCEKQMILPIGESIWRDTALVLDRNSSGSCFRSAITGEVLQAKKELGMIEMLATSPVAILESE